MGGRGGGEKYMENKEREIKKQHFIEMWGEFIASVVVDTSKIKNETLIVNNAIQDLINYWNRDKREWPDVDTHEKE